MNLTNGVGSILPPELLSRMGSLITILEAVGLMIIVYIIFNLINTFLNRRKTKEIKLLGQEMKRVNKNLNDLKRIMNKK